MRPRKKHTVHALMRDDGSERIGPSPYDEEHADHRGGEKEDERKRADWLRLWGGARLWTFWVSCEYERCGVYNNESDLLGEGKVPFCERDYGRGDLSALHSAHTPQRTRPAPRRISTCPNVTSLTLGNSHRHPCFFSSLGLEKCEYFLRIPPFAPPGAEMRPSKSVIPVLRHYVDK